MNNVDLHIHSRYSDGSLSISEIIDSCSNLHINTIAITDHDEVAGIKEAIELGQKKNIRVIPGIEITTTWDIPLHILGYNFNYTSDKIQLLCKRAKMNRLLEFSSIIGKLKKAGVPVNNKELAAKKIITINQLSRYLFEQGIGTSPEAVISKYFIQGGVAFVSKKGPTLDEVVQILHDEDGKVVLAHPGCMRVSKEDFWTYLNRIKAAGIDGIEAYSPHNNCEEIKDYCIKNQLIFTGGSDFHNTQGYSLGIGSVDIPMTWLN